jgi:dolichyl-phosphate beta-glucosyltransferase
MKVSIVIPAYNEAAKIGRDVEELGRFVRTRPDIHWEVFIVDDGSRDETAAAASAAIAKQKLGKRAKFEAVRYETNRGKGYAVRYGIKRCRGDYIGFVDSGLCVPFRYIDDALDQLKGGCDLAIASRRIGKARIVQAQPLYRRLGSKVFGRVAKILMGVKVSDTQCGFKFYTAKAASEIFSRIVTDGFMFDIEALLMAHHLGLKVGEFGVEWANDSDTRYNPVMGTLRNFSELMHIRLRTLTA